MIKIIAYPRNGEDYTIRYYDALERLGVRVIEGDFSLRWLIANHRDANFIHLHWPSFLYGDKSQLASLSKFLGLVFLLVLARSFGIRLLWTAHNLYPHEPNSIAVLDRIARKIVVTLSYRVFAHSSTAASLVNQAFPKADRKLVVIPHGHWIGFYPDECNRPVARTRLGISDHQFVFLFLGSCRSYKNLEYLVDCFQNGQFPGSVLWIVGRFQSAEYYARVLEQIKRQPQGIQLENRFVPKEMLQYYFAACDVVVLPYLEILTSGSAMTAMTFGRPVVAPRLGHLQDTINGECGVLYDPSLPAGLRCAMNEIRYRAFDNNLIRQHARKFNWEDAATRTVQAIS